MACTRILSRIPLGGLMMIASILPAASVHRKHLANTAESKPSILFVVKHVNAELVDTIKVARDTISIKEVAVKHEILTPEELFDRNKSEYRIIYLHGDNKNILEGFSVFPPVIVLNINKLYNHFSTSGKRARHLQQMLEDDFMQDKVTESWHPLTRKLTKLKGQELEDFQRYYQPAFGWWSTLEEYEKLDYTFKKLKNYQDSATYIREYLILPPINTIEAKSQ